MGVAVPVALSPVVKRRRDLAHHPDLPEYEQDVYRVAGHRLCIGCFTTLPVFMALSTYLFLVQPALSWAVLLATGAALAVFQVVSSLGRARTRRVKATVKTALGVGLAFVVYGVLIAPWSYWMQFAVLAVTLLLAKLSAVPRAMRMRRAAHRGCNTARDRA